MPIRPRSAKPTPAPARSSGWRIDGLGRLACPRCQQSDPGFRASRPVAVRDRDMALANTVPIPAVPGDGTARAPRCEAAMTRAALPAAIPRPAGRTWNGTTISRPMRPMHAGR